MSLSGPLYSIEDTTGLSEKETKRVVRAKNRWEYRNTEQGLEKERRAYLAKKFRISLEDYNTVFEFQNQVCAICGASQSESNNPSFRRVLPVDHDHNTGIIRGILCGPCNRALGQFKDNEAVLQKAIEYLRDPPVSKLKRNRIELGQNIDRFVGRRSPKERTDIKTEDIALFYQSDSSHSLRVTAKHFGLSDSQILERLKKAGIPRRPNGKSKKITNNEQTVI